MIKFKKDFLFGGSTSGPQTEGTINKNNLNVMDYWSQTNPQDFYQEIDSTTTSNMYLSYKDDIQLLKQVGIKLYRTSIQWSRLVKNFETNEVDENAVKFYRDYFQTLKDNDIKVIVNLYHFDTPIYWQEKGGWLNRRFPAAFIDYAEICFDLFGDLIDWWATMNEPIVIVQACYLDGVWYPKHKNLKEAVQVAYNEIWTNAFVIKTFKEIFRNDPNKKITTMLNLSPIIPKSIHPEHMDAAYKMDILHNKAFLDPIVKGTFPKELKDLLVELDALPVYTDYQLEIIKNNTIDFLGVNYYTPMRVQAPLEKNKNKLDFSRFYEPYQDINAKINKSRGWEIFPEGLKIIGNRILNEYNNISWWVSENGMGVQEDIIFDDYRIEFIKEHLEQLHQSIDEGSNCFAYCVWTPIDCWSWANAYKNRYGLISVDLETQKRTIKKSGAWFKTVSDTKTVN